MKRSSGDEDRMPWFDSLTNEMCLNLVLDIVAMNGVYEGWLFQDIGGFTVDVIKLPAGALHGWLIDSMRVHVCILLVEGR